MSYKSLGKILGKRGPILLLLLPLLFSGCLSHEEDLRGVPVTNNPTINPWGSHTAQGSGNGSSGYR